MSEKPTIFEALNGVMKSVRAVGKEGTNTFDGYNFRGIDGVLNHVGPALRDHGVFAVPRVEEAQFGTTTTGKGAVMSTTNVKMVVRWYGPAGDYIESVTWGSAFDRGDKSTAKAHSVAFRTALIQTLCLPTQEPDPDESSYEQGQRDMSGAEREKYVQDFAEKLLATEKSGDFDSLQSVLKWATQRADGELVRMTQQTIQRMQQSAQPTPVVDGEVMPDGSAT
ncbi:ERF family protein [uncultured Corynebacterium sp.]|uniref:ERF family protein n=1 Tax=uncultured Corynebacterium sp. TaxID=159447 RepID=UPI0025F9BF9E|nr:ERF family protein [uncultured Corynebacterium sp.]